MENNKNENNKISVLEVDTESVVTPLKKYKLTLFLNILIVFTFCIFLVCERVFRERINQAEVDLLEYAQPKLAAPFNFDDQSFWGFYYFIGLIGDFKFYCLIMTHIFISMYVSVDAIVGLKGLFVHCVSLYILTLLELIYQGARPFWICEHLTVFYCDNSFTNPSVLTFGFFFDGSYLLSLYLKKRKEIQLLENMQLDEDSQENFNKITTFLKVFVFVGIFLAHVLLFLRYIIGLLFIADYVMAMIYFIICFVLVKYLDAHIDSAIKSSTILKKKAREYVFVWIICLALAVLLAYLIFLVTTKSMPVSWLKNYMSCVLENERIYYKEDINWLMGPYPTFVQTTLLFGLVAGILGAQFCFNFVPNINWYKGTIKKRLLRVLVVNLCLIPSWVLIYFQRQIVQSADVRKAGINGYAIDAVHFTALFFVLYGLMPIFFRKLKMTHQDVQYSELINKNEGA